MRAASLVAFLGLYARAAGLRWFFAAVPPVALLGAWPFVDAPLRLPPVILLAVLGLIVPALLTRELPTLFSTMPTPLSAVLGVRWLVRLAVAEWCALPLQVSLAVLPIGDPVGAEHAIAPALWVAAWCALGCCLISVVAGLLSRWHNAFGGVVVVPFIVYGLQAACNTSIPASLGVMAIGMAAGTIFSVVLEPQLAVSGWRTGTLVRAAAAPAPPATDVPPAVVVPWLSERMRSGNPDLRLLLLAIRPKPMSVLLAIAVIAYCVYLTRSPFTGSMGFAVVILFSMGSGVLSATRVRMLGGRLPVQSAYVSALLTSPLVLGAVALLALLTPGLVIRPAHSELWSPPESYVYSTCSWAKRYRLPDGTILERDDYLRRLRQAHVRPDAPFLCEQLASLSSRDASIAVSAADCQPLAANRASAEEVAVTIRPGKLETISARCRTERALVILFAMTLFLAVVSLSMPTARGRYPLLPQRAWSKIAVGCALGGVLLALPYIMLGPYSIDIPAPDQLPEVQLTWWDRALITAFDHAALLASTCCALSALLIAEQLRRLRYLAVVV